MEPGRRLVAGAGVLLGRVTQIKEKVPLSYHWVTGVARHQICRGLHGHELAAAAGAVRRAPCCGQPVASCL